MPGGGAGRGHATRVLGSLQVLDRVVLLGLAVGHLDVLEVLGQLVHVGYTLGSAVPPAHSPDPCHQGVASLMTLRSLRIEKRSRVMMSPFKNVIRPRLGAVERVGGGALDGIEIVKHKEITFVEF